MKNQILKAIKGLKTFTIEDIELITGCDELEIFELIKSLNLTKKGDTYSLPEKFIKNQKKPKKPKKQKSENKTNSKGRIGFKTAAESFMEIAELKCTAHTFKSYKSALNKHLLPFFKEFRIAEVKPENIDRFIEAKLEEGLSHKTIDNIAKLLGSILEKALKDRYILYNPARAVRRF